MCQHRKDATIAELKKLCNKYRDMYVAVKLKQHRVNSICKSLTITDIRFKKSLHFIIMETILCESYLCRLVSLLDFSLSIVLSDCHNMGHEWDPLDVECFRRNPPLLFTYERELPWQKKKMLASDAWNPTFAHRENHLHRNLLDLSVSSFDLLCLCNFS